jgi:ABC-type transport system substrate-binding protein
MIKNRCLIIICLFLFAFITSCDKADLFSAAAEKNENILRFDVPAPLTPLNPTDIHATGSTIIYPLLYSYLCVPDENGQLQPDLADSWTYDPEILAWTIRLRTDAFYHNGQPVTLKDVKYSVLTYISHHQKILFEYSCQSSYKSIMFL